MLILRKAVCMAKKCLYLRCHSHSFNALESHAAGITISLKFHPQSKQCFLDWDGDELQVIYSQDGSLA